MRDTMLAVLGVALWACLARGEDWPTFGHDCRRSSATSERLGPPLAELWRHKPAHRPQPAWPAPARIDYWHKLRGLSPKVTYDRAYHVAVAGGAVAFGSSADDSVTCLDAATGKVRWTFITGGPVRLAPCVWQGRAYVGSDDGWVYCLAMADGAVAWKHRVGPSDRQVIGNGRMISAWPVRTGVLVDGGTAYCCAGLFPNEGVVVCALDAGAGSAKWKKTVDSLSPQGYLLASASRLYVPTGRTAPAALSRADGKGMGTFRGSGGAHALLSGGVLLTGPGKTGQVEASRAETREHLVTFAGERMLVTERLIVLQTPVEIRTLDAARYFKLLAQARALAARQKAAQAKLKKLKGPQHAEQARTLKAQLAADGVTLAQVKKAMAACVLWRRPCSSASALALSGDVLYTGADGEVAAYATDDGRPLWKAPTSGRAYGLAVADGRLFVSTDDGTIHCFGR